MCTNTFELDQVVLPGIFINRKSPYDYELRLDGRAMRALAFMVKAEVESGNLNPFVDEDCKLAAERLYDAVQLIV